MKHIRGFQWSVVLVIWLLCGCGPRQPPCTKASAQAPQQTVPGASGQLAPPPGSLDAFYPPAAQEPVYLLKMIQLGAAMSGIMVDLQEQDVENLGASFESFQSQYREISKLVPEWEPLFPGEPVAELGEALASKDPNKVMAAYGRVGGVCSACHYSSMAAVQFKYHWPDFKSIQVQDPVTGEDLGYDRFMQFLDLSMNGILVDLQQGQIENAKKLHKDFAERFKALKESCSSCHETERKHMVDESVEALVDKLGEALDQSTADPKAVQGLVMGIGKENCMNCHMVHVPAAAAKFHWASQGEE